MEQFKKTLKRRLYGIAGYCIVLLVLIVFGIFHPTAGNSEETLAFMAGFNVGLAVVALGVIITGIRKYSAALKDEEKLKTLYIEEHDERKLYIQSKMGGMAMQIILFGLLAATLAAGFFNQVVFFTLLGTLLFGAAVKALLKAYYTRKLT